MALASCVTLGNLLSLSEPPVPHLQYPDLVIVQVCSKPRVLRLHGIFHQGYPKLKEKQTSALPEGFEKRVPSRTEKGEKVGRGGTEGPRIRLLLPFS